MSDGSIILCQNHQKRKAYRYCEECKEFICNSCALMEKHLNHITKIKSFSDTLKSYLPHINSLNKNNLSKYIELFHFIINYNSCFMPFDLNNIMNQINDKFDSYINNLIDLKIKLKILVSEKFELINSIFEENEKIVLETQNKILATILNDKDNQYFEKMNTCLEQLRLNKNDKNNIEFIEKYNSLIKEAFENENDFNSKYNLYSAYMQVEKNNKSLKENILDKLIQPSINEAIKNIENIYQKINSQSNKDLDSLKKKFDYLIKNPNKNEIEDEEVDEPSKLKNIEEKTPQKNNALDIKLKAVPNKQEPLKKQTKEEPKKIIKEEPKKITKEEPKKIVKEEPKKIAKEEPKKIAKEEPQKPKYELLKIEFEPPDIESCQFTQKELDEMENDEEYENAFLKIEEDGDDGMLLAEIVDGNYSEQATVNLEEFFINNMDDKLDKQYYEGIKFEEENGGELLNEAVVVEVDEENREEQKFEEEPQNLENQKEEEKNEEIKNEEIKKEEIKKDEIKKEEIKKEEPPKEIKGEQPKKVNAIEEIKKKMFANKQGGGFNPQQMLKPIPENQPGKLPGKLNPALMNIMQNKLGGNDIKMPQAYKAPEIKTQKKKENLKTPQNVNIAQFIEDKNEQPKEESKKEKKEEIKEELKENIIKNSSGKDKLEILRNLVKSYGRNKYQLQTLLKELSWEDRGKVEIMAIDPKTSSVHIYNQFSNNIEEIKTNIKFPIHLSYINIAPCLYISGGKVNGKDSDSLQRVRRIGENDFQVEEIAKLKQGRSNHCTIYIQNINCLIFISGSRIKSCEKYSFTKEKIEAFPGLKVSREKCCACLINEKYLYAFFGFDRTKNKFETSVERIFIKDAMSWEPINIQGNQNLYKKQNFACIPIVKENKRAVIIVGGINSLRNETKETVFIDLDTNKGDTYSPLPFNSSFTNSYFTTFDKYSCSNEMFNISNEFNIVKFNLDTNKFYGL